MSYSTIQAILALIFAGNCVLLAKHLGGTDAEMYLASALLITTIVMMVIVQKEIEMEDSNTRRRLREIK